VTGIEPRDAVVVVTGAGSGIGRAVALRYADLGAVVIATDIDEASAKDTAERCRTRGARAGAYLCDVADADAVRRLSETVARDVGDVDVLVNNAGVGVGGSFLDTTEEDWTWLRSINLDGVIHGCRYFGAPMVERRRGQVVNVSSAAAYIPSSRMATYCATKAAVLMFSRSLRADWARNGVGVSAVCPGFINTPIVFNTRLRGSAVAERDFVAKVFRMTHSPDAVARVVTKVATRNRPMSSAGWEAQLSYHTLRMVPILNGLVARL
jgi:NAD(P)-dependent dehydrogenase (short-subunit alcohol dehydrogenase family)